MTFQEAVERQRPMKPIMKVIYFHCARCDGTVGRYSRSKTHTNETKLKYCSECGQLQDWSDYE